MFKSSYARAASIVSLSIVATMGVSLSVDAQTIKTRTDTGFDEQFDKTAKLKPPALPADAEDVGLAISPATRLFVGAAALHGLHTNPDFRDAGRRDVAFSGAELGAATVTRREKSETVVLARGTYQQWDTDFRPDRFNATLLLDHHVKLDKSWSLTVGGFVTRDAMELDRGDRYSAYVQAARSTATHELLFRMRSLHHRYLNTIGTLTFDGTPFVLSRGFSNTRTETSAGALVMKDQHVAPYVRAGMASIDFTHQPNEALIDRDAREVFAVAGVRLTLNKQLYVDFGARANHRRLDDARLASHDTIGFDGKLVWTPTSSTYLEVDVDRTYQEPLTTDALFTDRESIRIYASHQFGHGVTGSISAGRALHTQIGDDARFHERYVEGRVGYEVMPRAEVFGFVKTQQERETRPGTEATRENNTVGVGVRVGN